MVNLAKLVAARDHHIRATTVTTAANVPLIQPTLDRFLQFHKISLINLLTLEIDSAQENVTALPPPLPTPVFITAINGLRAPFEVHVEAHSPVDCIIADGLYPWANDVAFKFGIPRIIFRGSGCWQADQINQWNRSASPRITQQLAVEVIVERIVEAVGGGDGAGSCLASYK